MDNEAETKAEDGADIDVGDVAEAGVEAAAEAEVESVGETAAGESEVDSPHRFEVEVVVTNADFAGEVKAASETAGEVKIDAEAEVKSGCFCSNNRDSST